MRLGRTAWLALGIGAFVITLATLFMVYSSQSKEEAGLEKDLAGAETQLAKFVTARANLEGELSKQQNKLAEAQASLIRAKAKFPQSTTSIEYDEVLAEIIHANDLELRKMTAAEPRQEKAGDVTFTVLSFDTEVRGEVDNIVGMVNAIAADERLVSAGVTVLDMVPDDSNDPAGLVRATIRLVGYCYGGE